MPTPRETLIDALADYLAARSKLQGRVLATMGRGKELTVRLDDGRRVKATIASGLNDDGTISVVVPGTLKSFPVPLTSGLIDANPQLDLAPAPDFKRAEASFV